MAEPPLGRSAPQWVWRGEPWRQQKSGEKQHTQWRSRLSEKKVSIDARKLFSKKPKTKYYLSYPAWSAKTLERREAEDAAKRAKAALLKTAQETRAERCREAFDAWRRRRPQTKEKTPEAWEAARDRGAKNKEIWRDQQWRSKCCALEKKEKSEAHEERSRKRFAEASALMKRALLRWRFLRWRRYVAYRLWLRRKAEETKIRKSLAPSPPRRPALAEKERALWRRQQWRAIKHVDLRAAPTNTHDQHGHRRQERQRETAWQDILDD